MSESEVGRTKGVRAGARIGPSERISAPGDFARAYRDGRRGGDSLIRVIVCRNGLAHPRIAFAVGRKLGGATHRNKLRRIYREAFRLEKPNLPALDIIISPAREGDDPELARVRRSLVLLARQVASRLPAAKEPPT